MAVLRIHAPVLGRQERVLEWDGRPITVGRDEACDVVLLEQAASRHHARLERRDDALWVTDLGSANGVWVGPTRVEGTRALHDGDVVRIGDTTLTLVLDPHRQPTLYRAEASAPSPREDIGSGPTLAAAVAPVASAPAPVPPPLVPPRPPAPLPTASPPAASSPSAYSLGSEPTLAADSGPAILGVLERSSPSTYSLGSEPTLAADSGPAILGVHERSSPSTYSLGSEPTLAADSGPAILGVHERSSPSTYSLGSEPRPAAPERFGPAVASTGSLYLLGDAPAAEFRGPDVLPPAPSFDGAASSFELGAPPPPPGAPFTAPHPPFEPRPPAFVAPPQARSAASSWEWSEPVDEPRRRHGRPAGATLWLGLGLLIGGVIAMIVALAAGYQPSDLASLLGALPPEGHR